MLNLPIAMFNHLLFSLIFFLAQTADISIASPKSGDILRGQVDIVGNINVPNFASAELAFSYAIPVGGASNPADSWFTIQTFSQPVTDPTLAVWDTTTVTDGDYVLHLRVLLQDGSTQDVAVSDLKIRNDVPLPTVTPAATATSDLIILNPIPISSPEEPATVQPVTALPTFPSPTPLPANPAALTSTSIYSNFARGGLITLVLFAFFSLILRLRKN
jgi:hypothetical protein